MLLIYFTLPEPDVIGTYSSSLSGLSKSQKKNICLVAKKIDGTVINPYEEFSFNKLVGPRDLKTGFVPSKALFEGEVIDSIGGGVCLASSTLYNAVLIANMDIIKRVSHTKLIRSVPVGLDATVWYGINDLKFKNSSKNRIRIEAQCTLNRLNITIKGTKSLEPAQIIVKKQKLYGESLQVSVYRKNGNTIKKISEDIYRIK